MTMNVFRVIKDAMLEKDNIRKDPPSGQFEYTSKKMRYHPDWEVWELDDGSHVFVTRCPNHPSHLSGETGEKIFAQFGTDIGAKMQELSFWIL
jgi:hypothetical protein